MVTSNTTVIIGSDHGGFELKEDLKSYLVELGYRFIDFGCHDLNAVDYPDVAVMVAEAVSENEDYVGIMIDGLGIGSAMVANKVAGIRCAICWDVTTAVSSRGHNDANMLSIGGQVLGKGIARQIVKTWLSTPFSGGRHDKRVTKIMEVESRYSMRYRS